MHFISTNNPALYTHQERGGRDGARDEAIAQHQKQREFEQLRALALSKGDRDRALLLSWSSLLLGEQD
jgi:hypothetical protein